MSMVTIYIIIAFALGFYGGIQTVFHIIKLKDKKEKDQIEGLFINVLNNIKSIKFDQRVNQYVQFEIENYLLVYILDKKELSLYQGEECIASSRQISKKISDSIIKYINENFNKEINEDIVDVGGYLVSPSYIEEINSKYTDEEEYEYYEEEYEETLNLDDILDKINKDGIKSLTQDELEFLNNYK
jgi:hypothetical protein